MGGCTFANVVWSGHADLSPVLRIVDFRAENVTYDVQELQALGFRVEPEGAETGDAKKVDTAPAYWEVTEHGKTTVISHAEFVKRSFDVASFKPLYF